MQQVLLFGVRWAIDDFVDIDPKEKKSDDLSGGANIPNFVIEIIWVTPQEAILQRHLGVRGRTLIVNEMRWVLLDTPHELGKDQDRGGHQRAA